MKILSIDRKMKEKLQNKYMLEKPWGKFEQFVKQEPVTVKIITVNSQESLSLQYHYKREEFWKIISGKGEITLGDSVFPANQGDEYFIEKKVKHRIKAGDSQLKLLEISFGEFDEEDIVRLDDKYHRSG